jgi:putative membrane protein
MIRIALAVLHLLALGIGLAAIYSRARNAHRIGSAQDAVTRTFAADTFWGIAAILWIGTGLWRAFAGTDKTPSYYWHNNIFLAKMAFLVVILLLEIWPMMTLVRWRVAVSKDRFPTDEDIGAKARAIARISDVQTLLVVAMVTAAVLMARGYGAR